jgi:hypothetical protein
MLLPGDMIQGGDLPSIIGVYQSLADLLDQLTADDIVYSLGYGGAIEKEQDFLQTVAEEGQTAGHELTTLDYLFFFRLHHMLTREGVVPDEARRLELCRSLCKQWLGEVAPSNGSVRSGS